MIDIRFEDREFATVVTGQDQRLVLTAAKQAGDDAAIVEDQDGKMKGGIDIPIGVEHIFQHAVQATLADAIKLRPDHRATATELMTVGTMFFENLPACFRSGRMACETVPAFLQQAFDFCGGDGKLTGQPSNLLLDLRGRGSLEPRLDRRILK